MSLTDTPSASRLHIAFFGRRNSGKSSLINALTGQDTALVSDTPGTTTDLVSKAMEIQGIGPCLFIDTPGFDDEGELGELRISRTLKAIVQTTNEPPDYKAHREFLPYPNLTSHLQPGKMSSRQPSSTFPLSLPQYWQQNIFS